MGGLELLYTDAHRNRDNVAHHASTSTSTSLVPRASMSDISAFDSSDTATANSSNPTSCKSTFDLDTSDAQKSRDSAHGRFQGTVQQMDPSAVMREVLDKLREDGVPGPQLLRLSTEYNLELGKGTQFKVTAASRQHRVMLQRAHDSVSETQLKQAITFLSDSVVKRAHWIPEHIPRGVLTRKADEDLSGEILKEELHNQLQSAKVEIEKLCKKAIRKHRNIVELRGWGLCLDTFEEVTPLNTRIPLLLLERASCNLGDFLASSTYDHIPYTALRQICTDIGAGLGGLHQGNITHGDMKPENVLLFRLESQTGPSWTAKLCDFGNAESKPDQVSTGERTQNSKNSPQESDQVFFEYSGTPGWTPPEEDLKALDFEGLKRCDIFVYGLIVWRIFDTDKVRGCFSMKSQRRMRNIAAPIDEENMPSYRKQDRAYQKAAEAIKKSKIVPLHDRNRILRVVRAALQPIPMFRDRRPWRFLNNTYYSNIRNFDERPGRQSEEDPSPALNVVKSALLPYYTQQASEVSNAIQSSLNVARNYSSNLTARVRPIFPALRHESQEQQVFEEIFHHVSDPIELRRDVDGLQPLDHHNSLHELDHDLPFPSSLSEQGDLYHDALAKLRFGLQYHDMTAMISCEMRDLDDHVNAYARLRSRIKLCCWNEPTIRKKVPSMNCLEFFLKYSVHNETRAILPQRTSPHNTLDERIFSTVAWLCRGEVGEHELKTMTSLENIWYATCDSRLSPNLRTHLFLLFMQKGCLIGDKFEIRGLDSIPQLDGDGRRKTALRHFLERMMEGSYDINFRSDLIAQVCANIVSLKADNFRSERRSREHVRCFFRGETPEGTSEGLLESERALSNTLGTTILHEAVLASCYTAVEYLADSGFPLSVWDHDGKTPLDFAIYHSKRKAALEPWRITNNNLIIGILTKKHAKQTSGGDLPLGWEETQSECGTKVYSESTVNPESPSITFRTPQFSLLQERKIAIGSRKDADAGQEYRFDLVRFIQRPKLDIIQQGVLRFDDDWYKRDIVRIKAISATEISSYEDERPWIRFPARVASVIMVVLLRDYSSILLILIPLSIAARICSWNTPISIILSTASLVALARIWDTNLGEIYPNSIPSNQGQSLISVLGSCGIEFCVGISAILHGQTDFAQAIIIGSILCNQLLIPGIGLTALSVRFHTSAFNQTSVGIMSNLIILASAFSTILFLFSFTSDTSQVAIEASVLLLSRAASIIAVVIFLLWLVFRYKTHNDLFENDAHDGYEEETMKEPLINPLAAFVVCALCMAFIVMESDSFVLPILRLSPAKQTTVGIYLVPTIIRLGKHGEIVRDVRRNMEDDVIDLTIGFTVNISFYLSPILVLLAWTLGRPLSLAFGLFETIVYGLCGWFPAFILADGRSTYIKGLGLLVVYALITLAFAIYHE